MKNITEFINEAKIVRVYPEDWHNISDAESVINCIMSTLDECGMIEALATACDNSLDPHIFTDKKFINDLSKELSNAVLDTHNQLFN